MAGFDDLAFSAAVSPSLTTMAQDLDAVARGALAALTARIAGRAAPPEAAVPMTLIERESTGPAPGASPTVLGQGDDK